MCGHRSLVFVEGDASMSTYQDAEGKTRSSLNVVQRTSTTNHPLTSL